MSAWAVCATAYQLMAELLPTSELEIVQQLSSFSQGAVIAVRVTKFFDNALADTNEKPSEKLSQFTADLQATVEVCVQK